MHVVAVYNVSHQQAVSFSGVVQDANPYMLQGVSAMQLISAAL